MIDPKRQEEERKRIMQKYGTRERKPEFDPNTSRYMEYRKQEKLRKEMAEHPEKFIKNSIENPIPEQPIITEEPIELPKKKSFFAKLFKR
jgi:hypothetical protein